MSILRADNISFSYQPGKFLFSDFDLSVASGERVALQASSGFGKTTLCQILAGYLKPQQGSVFVGDQPLPEKGVCPVQMIWQHPETAVDPRLRLRTTLEEAGGLSERILEQLGIKREWLSRYPHELSGGELQRFCIARALGAHPSFLIADEISTMLDAVTQAEIWKFLLKECEEQNIGMVLVTHSLALSDRLATRVVKLD